MNRISKRGRNPAGPRRIRAAATVETAVVMGAALLAQALVLFAGLYLHDKCILTGAAHETAQVQAERIRMEDDRSAEGYFRERIAGKMLYFPSASCSVSAGGGMVKVLASARTGRMSVTAGASAPLTEPEEEIRRLMKEEG